MNPTKGPWLYVESVGEVQTDIGIRTLARMEFSRAYMEESTANGYLMAAAPQLRDELGNLARAVRAYTDATSTRWPTNREGREALERAYGQMQSVLQRAERALATIFPPDGTA